MIPIGLWGDEIVIPENFSEPEMPLGAPRPARHGLARRPRQAASRFFSRPNSTAAMA